MEIKTNEEIEKLKKSSKLADDCYEYICNEIKIGMTEIEIAEKMKSYFLEHGASDVSFDLIVGSGVNSSQIHSTPTERKIEYGDLIQLDFGCILDGYCSDCSRVVFIGEIKPQYKYIYDIVYSAQIAGIEKFEENMTASQVDALSRDVIKARGYDFEHAVGHAVGTEVHEKPVISFKNTEAIIKDNMCITIEPGIYIKDEFGIRIEDTCIVENGKLIPLNKTSKEIKILNA